MRKFSVIKLNGFYGLKYKGKIILLMEEKSGKIIIHNISDIVKFRQED